MEFLQEIFDEAKFYGLDESIRRLQNWIFRYVNDYYELIDFFELYSHSNDCLYNDDQLIYFGIKFNNPYLAARVVGMSSFDIDLKNRKYIF